MALGAARANVFRMVLAEGARLTGLGVLIGLAAALAVTQLMKSFLYGIRATDPITFVAVSALLVAVGLLACYLPARRATRVDPIVALRYEYDWAEQKRAETAREMSGFCALIFFFAGSLRASYARSKSSTSA